MAINLPNYERQTTILNNTVEILDEISRAGKSPRRQLFLSDGTWVAPAGVTRVFVTGGGGGGGGGLSINAYNSGIGSAGGTTSFGTLLSLPGGGGGKGVTYSTNIRTEDYVGFSGGFGGENGLINGRTDSTSGVIPLHKGGDSGPHKGSGGQSTSSNDAIISMLKGDYCSGGGGLIAINGSNLASGGGGAMYVSKRELEVTPGQSYPIIIGKGGSGGSNATFKASDGGDGYLIIEWWE